MTSSARLVDAPVRSTLIDIRSRIEAFPDEVRATMNAAPPDGALDRLDASCALVDGLLVAADARFVPQRLLDDLDGTARRALDQLLATPGDPADMQGIDVTTGELVQSAGALATATPFLHAAADDVRQALGGAWAEQVLDLRGAWAETAAAQAQALQALAAEQATNEEAVAERQREHAAQLKVLDSAITAAQAKLDGLDQAADAHFATEQSARKEVFDDTLAEWEAGYGEALAAARAKGEEIDAIYSLVTDKATAGALDNEALAQRKIADLWRWIAVGVAVALIGFAVVAFVAPGWVGVHDIWSSTTKVTLTVALGGLATYAGAQAAHHRRREEEARRLAIELVTFEPFIEKMEDSDKLELRKEYALRAFRGRADRDDRAGA